MNRSIIYTLKHCRFFNRKIVQDLFITHLRQITSYKLDSHIINREDEIMVKATTNYLDPIEYFSWLHNSTIGFPIDASKITIIHEPNLFYKNLLDKCRKAEERITLASLYLGTGELEEELVKAIEESVIASDGKVKVNILLDYMRGSRGKKNSRKMLEPLLKENCVDSCKICLYHTPKLRGVLKTIIPNRFNELIGLQHMKVYIFDDSLIISGANLSNDYFTNRQDRYFLIEDCKELCDFYSKLIKRVSEFSFRLLPGNKTSFDNDSNLHPLNSASNDFSRAVKSRIISLYYDEMNKNQRKSMINHNSSIDTWVFPLIQMGQLGISQDNEITLKLLKTAPSGTTLRLATGYFNLTKEYTNAILRDCKASCQLLTAHPTANGFFGAKGVAGGIPAAYTTIEKSFYKRCEKLGLSERISLREYVRPGWTYHAKGLWYTLPNQKQPSLTLIGSSNFGYRSVKRDLETQIAIVTKNARLQNALEEEYERIYRNSEAVTRNWLFQRDRIAPAWVCTAVLLFRYYF
ncbi:hypothetical protein PV327_008689 [Microctonus hyperodae]|uniref:CDP-diacylglycerol--glycerol-3-phosphate 3-phosphatidyltransferase n=1 Tax=Microctonus hyperodae TaxID=165561 RepID=A0AA39F3M5_MICHY|nr:hypothetical protein PV327_008689 [Microctonus hyperodae]